MSNFRARSITAVFIVGVTLAAVLLGPITCFAFIALICLGTNFEIGQMLASKKPGASILFAILTSTPFFIGFGMHFEWVELNLTVLLVLIPIVICLLFAFSIQSGPAQISKLLLAGALSLGYVSLSLLSASEVGWENGSYRATLILSAILMIWTNDTFAYLTGSRIGKTPMAPLISPKKTWEGTSGGLVFAILIGIIIFFITKTESIVFWAGLGLVVGVISTIGDLIQSSIKRYAGVKDSGNLLPGHGGIFDRYDSFICVLPFVYLYTTIVH